MQPFNQTKIKKKEVGFTYIYGTVAFLTGFFLSTFDIVSHVKFFASYDFKVLTNSLQAFTISLLFSAIIGIILSYLFSLVFRRINTKTLALVIFGFVTALVSVYYFLLFGNNKYINFFGITLFFPINTIMLLALWRFGRKMLYSLQSKSILPIFKNMLFTGMAAGGVVFTAGLFQFRFEVMIVVSYIVLLLAFSFLYYLSIYHKNAGVFNTGMEKMVPVSRSIFLFFSSKISRRLYFFALLSAILGYSIHFVFINVSMIEFENIVGKAKFYGLFIFTLMLFIFVIDKFLLKRILYSYDSPYSLIVIPLIVFGTLILTIGGLFVLGSFTLKNEHLTIFILLLIIAKVGYVSSMYTIQTPSLRTLFHTLDIRFRQVVFPRIEGSVVMLGLLITSLVLLGLTFLPFFTLKTVLYFGVLISLLWIWSAIKLIQSYRTAQGNELVKMRFRKSEMESDSKFQERLWKLLVKDEAQKIQEALKLSQQFQPLTYENDLSQLLAHPSVLIQNFVVEKLKEEKIDVAAITGKQGDINFGKNRENEDISNKIIPEFNEISDIDVEEAKKTVYSGSLNERIELIKLIAHSSFPEKEGILSALSKDFEPEIQQFAIKELARLGCKEYCYSLIDFIHTKHYNPYAFEALAASGDNAIDFLEKETINASSDKVLLARIAKLYGKIGTQKAIDNLLSIISEVDNYGLNHCIQALVDARFHASSSNRYKILSLIVKTIGFITNNLNIIVSLGKNKKTTSLYEAYNEEFIINYNNLFRLLSLVYNANVITALQNMFIYGSQSKINHALELIDQYIDLDIKPLLFPLIENISIINKLERLEYYFPQVQMSIEDIISNTLTHNFNSLSIYPRAVAIMLIEELNLQGFDDELAFCAAHPDKLLSETALYLLKKNKPEILSEIIENRIEANYLESETDLHIPENKEELLYKRITELKNFSGFSDLSEHVGISLAVSSRKIKFNAGEAIDIAEIKKNNSLLLADWGKRIAVDDKIIEPEGLFIYLNLLEHYNIDNIYPERDISVWVFNAKTVQELLYDNIDLANKILTSIDKMNIYFTNGN